MTVDRFCCKSLGEFFLVIYFLDGGYRPEQNKEWFSVVSRDAHLKTETVYKRLQNGLKLIKRRRRARRECDVQQKLVTFMNSNNDWKQEVLSHVIRENLQALPRFFPSSRLT